MQVFKAFCVLLLCGLGGAASAAELNPQKVMIKACAGCHAFTDEGKLSRIKDIRKTPEGWDMTLVRMGIWHDVQLTPEERRLLVKYLADTQGLAPEETADYRGLLERRPNMQPPAGVDEEINIMCARCHSYGRIALQRRDEAEWRKLAHTHLGQIPSAEYQNFGRDRQWWEIARDQMPPKLAALYPLQTDTWQRWQSHPAANPAGTWRVSGERPGKGRYTGMLTIEPQGKDHYRTQYELTYADGSRVSGQGTAVLYTGYEWRGVAKLGEENTRSVYALSADGQQLTGRWFLKGAEETGAELNAVRIDEQKSGIVAVEPPFIRQGQTTPLTIFGYGLQGAVQLGPGLTVKRVIQTSPEQVSVEVQAGTDGPSGRQAVAVGTTRAAAALTVYKAIDTLRVEPEFAIARIGGGAIAPVEAQLQAVGYLNGPDGQPATADDIRLGSFPARWRTANFNEVAAAMKDADFAGHMTDTGLFVPAAGGPNPARKYRANNTGDLKITAQVEDGGQTVQGEGHLVVTVQRWNTPPIR